MAVRYRADFKSKILSTATQWRVDIADTNYSGSITTFKLDGFQLNYQGENSDRFNPVIASQITIPFLVENSSEETFINDIVTNQEGTFTIAVYKNAALNFYWGGTIIPDIATIEDRSFPYHFTLTATDGLGKLKTIDYNNNGTAYSGYETILNHVFNCLGKTGNDVHFSGSQNYLHTIVNWIEDSQRGGVNNVLVDTRLNHAVFTRKNSKGKFIWKSTFDVLKQLCQIFGAKIYFNDGVWLMEQITERINANHRIFKYDVNKVELSTTTESDTETISSSTNIMRAGRQFSYFAALKKVEITYKHDGQRNFIEDLIFNEGSTSNQVVFLNSASDDTFIIKGTIASNSATTATFQEHRHIFRLKFQIGSNYLKRTAQTNGITVQYSDFSWSTDIAYVEIVTDPVQLAGQTFFTNFEFETPKLNIVGSSFQFQFFLYQTVSPVTGTISAGYIFVWDLLIPSLTVVPSGDPANVSKERKYKAVNTDLPNNTAALELETLIGDGIFSSTSGKLQVSDGTSWSDSSVWKVNGTGTGHTLQELLINEILKTGGKNVERMNAAIIGNFTAKDGLLEGSKRWLFLGGTFDAKVDQWNGEWFVIANNITNVTNTEEDGPVEPQETPGPVPGEGTNTKEGAVMIDVISVAVVATEVKLGAITEIDVTNDFKSGGLTEGQSIFLVNPFNPGVKTELKVNQTVKAGDTKVKISGFSDTDFPKGSYLVSNPQQEVTEISGGSPSAATSTVSDHDIFVEQLFTKDQTLSESWKLQFDNIWVRTDDNAGDGSTGGLVFDGDGLQVFESTSATPVIQIKKNGDFLFQTKPTTGDGSSNSDGIKLLNSGGIASYPVNSLAPSVVIDQLGNFDLGRADVPLKSSGRIFSKGGVLFNGQADNASYTPQYGFIKKIDLFGWNEDWAVGLLKGFWGITSEYVDYEVYKIGWSMGAGFGSGSLTNTIKIKFFDNSITTTSEIGSVTLGTSGPRTGILTPSPIPALDLDDAILFDCTGVKSIPAKGFTVDLYFRLQ